MVEGVDYAWGRPGGAALANAGKHFAMRYVPYNGDGGKGLTLTEKRDLLEHGLTIGLVFETFANRAKDGFWAGQNDARLAQIGLGMCSMPANSVIYFAVDFDANVGQRTWDANVGGWIKAYLDGVASIIGRARTGVYGGFYVVEWALRNRIVTWGWQTYAWSSGHVSTNAHLLQYWNHGGINGVPVDLNKNLKWDFGQYPRPSGSGSVPNLPDTALPPPEKPRKKRRLPMEAIVPDPPQMVTVPASVVYREHPRKEADKVQQFGERKTFPLVYVVKGGEYEADGAKHSRWGLVRLPAFWTKDDPWDGKWAYVPLANCETEECKPK